MITRRLNSGDIRRLAKSLAIVGFYDLPQEFDAGASVYGEMYLADNLTGLVLVNQNQFYKWINGWIAGESNGVTVDPVNAQIQATIAGAYRASLTFGASNSTPNQVLEFSIFKNGVYQPDHSMHLALPNNRGNSGAIVGILSLAAGDIIDVRVQNTSGAGQTLTIEDANLTIA